MRKYITLLFAAVTMAAFVGCSSDDDAGFNYVTFESNSMNLAVQQFGSQSREVTVYTGNVSGSDRTFDISVDPASTVNAEAYTVPETVTIPGGTNEATFTIEVADNNLSNEGGTLVLRFASEEGLYTGNALTFNVSKICDFDPVGTYTNNSGFFETEVPAEIMAGDAAGEFVIPGLFAEGTDITFTVNADNSITVPAQNGWVSADYGQVTVTGQAASRVEPCTGRVVLALEHTVSAGSFGVITETLTKGDDAGEDTDGEDTDGEDTED